MVLLLQDLTLDLDLHQILVLNLVLNLDLILDLNLSQVHPPNSLNKDHLLDLWVPL